MTLGYPIYFIPPDAISVNHLPKILQVSPPLNLVVNTINNTLWFLQLALPLGLFTDSSSLYHLWTSHIDPNLSCQPGLQGRATAEQHGFAQTPLTYASPVAHNCDNCATR